MSKAEKMMRRERGGGGESERERGHTHAHRQSGLQKVTQSKRQKKKAAKIYRERGIKANFTEHC